ncbi:MAG: hypothetical protein IPH52_06440 [Leptospiraceae bacterium]|nr:hypothetical protein [Leptospiraceae bacterium]
MKWIIVIICFFTYQCRFFDYRQEALTGTTFQERNWNKETKSDIFFFSSKIKNLSKGKNIFFTKIEFSVIPGIFGNMLGNTAYRDNFSDYFPIERYRKELTEGQYLIIHNIRIKYNSNVLFDWFKTYSVIMFGYYTIEAELNFISENEFGKILESKGREN